MAKQKSKQQSNKIPETQYPNRSFFIGATVIITIITAFIYSNSLNNQFLIKWDDNIYVTDNAAIRTYGDDGFWKNTFTSYVHGNYHPLTMLSFSLEYDNTSALNPRTYHKTNLILHIFNSLLVFIFIWLLTKKRWISFITAILFAIHPMHVESVAWISERKDLLYAFFFLAALCTYILFIDKKNKRWLFYVFTILFFACSTLSKGMAVSFPIVLFFIDFFKDRKITIKTVMEKIPFLIIAVIMGLVAIQAQKDGNALNATYSIIERLFFACYAVLLYLWKLLIPLNLSSFHEFPSIDNILVRLSPIVVLALLFLIYYSLKFGKTVFVGFGLFFATIVFVLQIIPVGEAIIAERYTYLPYIGLFFIIGYGLNLILENETPATKKVKMPLLVIFSIFIVGCSVLTKKQNNVWHDDVSLWTAAIESDANCAMCYKNRGDSFGSINKKKESIEDFTVAISLKPDYSEAYNNRGVAYAKSGLFNEAIKDFEKAIKEDPNNVNAFNNIGNYYFTVGNYEEAITAYNETIELKSDFAAAIYNRALAYSNLGKNNLAYQDALKAQQFGYAVDLAFIERLKEILN